MMHRTPETELRAARNADEWKRKFQKEIKELKQLLHDEKVQFQQLATQFQDYKAQHQCDSCPTKFQKECSKCLKLKQELEQLKKPVKSQNQQSQQQQHQSNQECEYSPELEATVVQSEEHDDDDEQEGGCTPTSLSAPTLIKHSSRRNDSDSDSAPQTPADAAKSKLETPETPHKCRIESASVLPALLQPAPVSVHPNQLPQQLFSKASLPSMNPLLVGYEDKSLGELFKYAVVLAGPTPKLASVSKPVPKRFPLLQRKSFADYRRTRSLPENQQHQPEPAVTTNMSENSDSEPQSTPHSAPTPSKFKLLSSRSNRLTSKYSQTLLDFISEEPSVPLPTPSASSSQRKPGWLSNLVSQRFRGATGGSSGTTAAEAPARLTTVPDLETGGQHQPVSHSAPLTPASKLLCVYPPQTKQVAELEGLVELCFPYGGKMPPASDFTIGNLKRTLQERHRTYRSPNSTFVLTIASQSNPCDVTYAICVICPLFADEAGQPQPPIGDDQEGHDESATQATGSVTTTITQCCLCLLSPYPFFSLFFKVLFGVAVLWEAKQRDFGEKYALALKENRSTSDLPKPPVLSDFVDHFQDILSKLKHMRIPSMGGWSRMSLSPELLTTQLSFHRPHSKSLDMERRVLLLEYAAPTLFALLSVDQVLFLLGCLCCEHKVLVVSDHVNTVSSCVLALITLLSPLQWAGPVITVLPPRLDELLEAPVPLIAGRVSIDSALIPNFSTLQTPMKGVIEMNMDQNNLQMHDEDTRNYHELKLPGCDALVHELKFFSAQLFQKHIRDPDFPSVHQQEACEIICTRIHRHLEFICGLALGEDTGGVVVDASSKQEGLMGNPGAMPQDPGAVDQLRSCSDLTLDYIRRFKETQMFSMFQLQRQEQQQEAELAAAAEEDDEADDENLDGEEYDEDGVDLHTGDGDPDALFAVESISYEPDLLVHC